MRRRDLMLSAAAAASAWPVLALADSPPLQPVEVRDDGLFARFYSATAPRGAAVLMLGGSDGGYPYAKMAADLAASGFPTLAVAYFRNYQGQPAELGQKALAEVPLEYLFKAIDRLHALHRGPIVIMGESRGAELALQLASLRRDVAGVIAFSPSHVRWQQVGPGGKAAWTLGGKPLPFLNDVYDPKKTMVATFNDALDGPKAPLEAAVIEVEKINGPVLLISSTADQLWPSSRMADAVEARLKAKGFRHQVRNLKFPDASHLMMGYGPQITELQFGDFKMVFGGTAEGTVKARDAGWAAAKDFLSEVGKRR